MDPQPRKGVLVDSKFFARRPDGTVEVVGSRCRKCGRVYFPKKRVCVDCLEWGGVEEAALSKRGKLVSFSVSRDPMRGFPIPYAFGYVLLPEGIMLYSLFTDCEPYEEKLKIGMEMEMVIDYLMTDRWDNDIVCYKFRPVRAPGSPAARETAGG
ncbi:MAG: OB-fold domain-containing protein [bacterium]